MQSSPWRVPISEGDISIPVRKCITAESSKGGDRMLASVVRGNAPYEVTQRCVPVSEGDISIFARCVPFPLKGCFQVFLWSGYRSEPEFLHQYVQHIGRQECRKGWPNIYVLDAKCQECKKYAYSFLFIP